MSVLDHLYDYQREILDALRAGFAAGHRVQVLYAPTGAGKTEMAIALMDATSRKYNRSAILLDRIVLCDQTSARLTKYGVDHGVLQAGHWRYRPYERAQVCSAQFLEKRGDFPDLTVLIVDECHAQRAKTLAFIRNNPNVKVIGLTATPFTKGLGKTYTNVVCTVTTEQLVNDKRLVPLKVYIAKEIDMTGAKKVAGEWSSDEVAARGMLITGDVVAEWVQKTHEHFGGPRKTIVFCANVAHGEDLARKFEAAGYNFLPITYRDDDDFKREAIEDFAKPDTKIHGLIACDILTKGFDVPDVMIGVSARPYTKSLSSHIQQMGRVMRAAPSKEFALWLDHSGNYLRFQEDWEKVYHEGVKTLDDGREKTKKEKSPKEKEEAKCPVCSLLWPRAAVACPSCGHVRQRRSEVIELPGRMEALGEVGVSKKTKQLWYSMFLHMQREKGRNPGWVAHKFRERFGVWPRGFSDITAEPTLECRSWVQSRQIAFARSQGKKRQAA